MTTLRVKAIQPGYYGSVRRDPGDKKHGSFVLTKASHFSKAWMEADGWDVEAEQAKEKSGATDATEVSEVKAKPKVEAAPAKPAPAAPTPIKASTETTVTPPATAPKQVSPITGQDI